LCNATELEKIVKAVLPRLLWLVSRLSARLGEQFAWYLWFHPFGRRTLAYPEGSSPLEMKVFGHEIRGFQVGSGQPVLLLHGWGGTSTDMAPLAEALAGAGYLAVAPDLPGHGHDRGAYTDVFQMAATVDALAGVFGSPHAVVAHSFGAVVTFAAFQHGGPARAVLVAPAMKGERYLEAFRVQSGLSARAHRRFVSRFVGYAGPHMMDVFAGNGDVPGARMLILHDPADRSASYADAADYAANRRDTRLVEVPHTGHKGILRDDKTRDEVLAFVTERARPAIPVGDAAS
jgi:pimeloyl-ACP methyl ester carboxylesterase